MNTWNVGTPRLAVARDPGDDALAFVDQLARLSFERWCAVLGAHRTADGGCWRAAAEDVNNAIGRSRRMRSEGDIVRRVMCLAQAMAPESKAVDRDTVYMVASMAALALLTRDELNPDTLRTLLAPFASGAVPNAPACW